VRDPERADEVAAGASMHDRELDAVDARDPVHDLVHCAVPADGDDQVRASRRGVVRELGQVLRPFGEERVAGEAAIGCEPGDLGPALPGLAPVGGGIDQKRRGANRT
jgi:hypothetical protein